MRTLMAGSSSISTVSGLLGDGTLYRIGWSVSRKARWKTARAHSPVQRSVQRRVRVDSDRSDSL